MECAVPIVSKPVDESGLMAAIQNTFRPRAE
jgi:hypothetical protein